MRTAVRSIIAMALIVITACAFAPGRSSAGEEAFVPARSDAVIKTDDSWKALLDSEEYRILRRAGTERAFTGKYWDNKDDGTYQCAGCGLPLFEADTKFVSGTGWPSFWAAVGPDHVAERVDSELGMIRTEILCNRCGGHLGHVFPDGPPPTGRRYCVNGNALDFVPGTDATPPSATPDPKTP